MTNTDDRPKEPIIASAGGIPYNKPWLDYWRQRALAADAIIEAQSKALAEARETNRRLNRTNQKLHSDIANDRHLLTTFDTPWTPDTAAQVSVERQSWPHKRDTAMLHFHKESVRYRKALEKVRSYNVDIAAGHINYRPHDHIQIIDEALTPTPENPNG